MTTLTEGAPLREESIEHSSDVGVVIITWSQNSEKSLNIQLSMSYGCQV